MTDPLPVGMQVASHPARIRAAALGAIISADSGATEVSLQNGVIPAGGPAIWYLMLSWTGLRWTNTIAPGGIQASGGIINQDPVSATLAYEQRKIPLSPNQSHQA